MTSTSDDLVWHKVLNADELPEGRVTSATCAHLTLCMTRYQGQYGALDNKCPHQGGPLGEGSIESPGSTSVCRGRASPREAWFPCEVLIGATRCAASTGCGIRSCIRADQADSRRGV